MLLWQIVIVVLFVVFGVLTMFYCFGDSNNPFRDRMCNPLVLRKLGRKILCLRKKQQEAEPIPNNIFVISTNESNPNHQQQSNTNNNNNNNNNSEQLNNRNSVYVCDMPPSYDELFSKFRESQRGEKF